SACCVLGGSNEHDPPRPTIAPENDRDRRSLASISNRCPLFSRHHDWPSLDLTWRRRCVVAGGGACLRLECRQGAACAWRRSYGSASPPEAIGTTRMRVTENVRGSASLARRRGRFVRPRFSGCGGGRRDGS